MVTRTLPVVCYSTRPPLANDMPLPSVTSLRIGERVVSICDDGLLVAEYALFEASDAVLHSTDPVTVREAGYMTTAQRALARLALAGVTPELAEDAARAIPPEVIVAYGRGEATRGLAGRRLLGAHELFDGAVFRAGARPPLYEGMWLNLRALTAALEWPDAPLLLQALHLAAALAEVTGTVPVHLSTAAATAERRPGERTFQPPALDGVGNAPDVLRRLELRATPDTVDMVREARLLPALVARVRERMAETSAPSARARLMALEQELARHAARSAGPLGNAELRAIEQQIERGDPSGVDEQLDRLEASQGSVPAIRYLRARVALLRGERPPRYVAQELSRLAEIDHGFQEAALGAARTWLAAGENAHARYFAHRLAEDPSADDSKRIVAMEILQTTPETRQSPPPRDAQEQNPEARAPAARVPLFPALGNVPAPRALPPSMSSLPPPVRPAAPGERPRQRYDPELVEPLALPPGSTEEDLPTDDRPTTAAQARIAMTRLARDLARDYRLWYGRTLRCDIHALDAMQQHLRARHAGATIEDPAVAWELRRHGALLSEIVARALGGAWTDVGATEPGYWVMTVPPGVRTCPIGRVYRFVTLGRQERDLVGHYFVLEERARRA
jgi:hypothetical protein